MHTHLPPAEVEIDAALVRRLLATQHPDLADRELAFVGEGWDNAMFRLGSDLVVRIPRRAAAAELVLHETRALAAPPDADAERFVDFLIALHTEAPADAPENAVRGVPLVEHAEGVESGFAQLREETGVVTPAIEAGWADALAAPVATTAVWLHGDLHGRNVLLRDGRLAAIIDWGDVTSGDAACDLAALWMLFEDPDIRAEALDRYRADPGLRGRALGSAIRFATVLLAHGREGDPRLVSIGANTFRRVETDLAQAR